jgi:hypothetical protein
LGFVPRKMTGLRIPTIIELGSPHNGKCTDAMHPSASLALATSG